MESVEKANVTKGVRVFVTCDLDVPIRDGQVVDTFRLDAALPALKYLQDKGAQLVLAGHLGRPDGHFVPELSTKLLVPYFKEKLGEGGFELLENLRFDPREEQNDDFFAVSLAKKADLYVNECFSTSHRAYASIIGVPKYLPAYAGLRLMKEVETLHDVIKNPRRPLTAIVGGVKLETKLPAVFALLKMADYVLVGGKLGLDWHGDVVQNLILPKDYALGEKDIGPETIAEFRRIIALSKSVIWSGPMGAYEESEFSLGTAAVIEAISTSGVYSVVGGGDTIGAIKKLKSLSVIDFISTGGGAMLKFLVGEPLPGLMALGYA